MYQQDPEVLDQATQDVAVSARPRHHIQAMKSVTNQLKIGDIVLITKFAKREHIRKEIENPASLRMLGFTQGSIPVKIHNQLHSLFEEINEKGKILHFFPIQKLRQTMSLSKISAVTGIVTAHSNIAEHHANCLMKANIHVLIDHQLLSPALGYKDDKDFLDNPLCIYGIVRENFKGEVLDPHEFFLLQNTLKETLNLIVS